MTYYSFKQLGECKGLKLVTMNVQSLCDKIERIRKLDLKVDYMCVTETWLNQGDQDHSVSIPGMTSYRNDRINTQRKSGGVACYIKDCYAEHTELLADMTITTCDIECIGIVTKFPTQKYRVVLTVYRPPKGNVKKCTI